MRPDRAPRPRFGMLIYSRSLDLTTVHLKGRAITVPAGPPSRWSRAKALEAYRVTKKRVEVLEGSLAKSKDTISRLKLREKEFVARIADTEEKLANALKTNTALSAEMLGVERRGRGRVKRDGRVGEKGKEEGVGEKGKE